MDWWKKNKWKVLAPVLVIAVLAAAFWYGGSAPNLQGWTVAGDAVPGPQAPDQITTEATRPPETNQLPETAPQPEISQQPEAPAPTSEHTGTSEDQPPEGRPGGLGGGMSAQEKVDAAQTLAGTPSPVPAGDEDYSESQGMVIDPETGKDKYLTDPVPEGKPLPVEPQDAALSDQAHTCTLSISCAAILDHMDRLDPEKAELVPEDGWILPAVTVTFYEGESVFNVLQRACKQQGIHMEFEHTPMYNSAYIEGIQNLYEFDCGELSGWMYKVNEWFPNYGCSRYQLQDGDVICWEYTCDLGADIGGFNAIGG